MTAPASRRRWCRYSLRTLFVLVTIVCVWLGVQVTWIRNRHEAIDWVLTHNGGVSANSSAVVTWFARPGERAKPIGWGAYPAVQVEKQAPWPIRILGEHGIAMIVVVLPKQELDERVERIRRLFPEADVIGAQREALER